MESSRKAIIVILVIAAISIFGYSQYIMVSEIEISISQSELSGKDKDGSNYNIELQIDNPSLLLLTGGETEFFVISNDKIIGKGSLEPFILPPLDSGFAKGTFHTDANAQDESLSIKISGVTKYDMLITSIDVPFVFYPTKEQAREFIHQN